MTPLSSILEASNAVSLAFSLKWRPFVPVFTCFRAGKYESRAAAPAMDERDHLSNEPRHHVWDWSQPNVRLLRGANPSQNHRDTDSPNCGGLSVCWSLRRIFLSYSSQSLGAQAHDALEDVLGAHGSAGRAERNPSSGQVCCFMALSDSRCQWIYSFCLTQPARKI